MTNHKGAGLVLYRRSRHFFLESSLAGRRTLSGRGRKGLQTGAAGEVMGGGEGAVRSSALVGRHDAERGSNGQAAALVGETGIIPVCETFGLQLRAGCAENWADRCRRVQSCPLS